MKVLLPASAGQLSSRPLGGSLPPRRSPMADVKKLVAMLRSPNPSVRYEACGSLRVAPEITRQAIEALENATRDPQPDVAERARSALLVHRTPTIPSSAPVDAHKVMRSRLPPRQPRALDYIIAALPGLAA